MCLGVNSLDVGLYQHTLVKSFLSFPAPLPCNENFRGSDSAQRTNKSKKKIKRRSAKLPDCKTTESLDLLLASSPSHPPPLSLPLPFPFPSKPQGAALGLFISVQRVFFCSQSSRAGFSTPNHPQTLFPSPEGTEFPGCRGWSGMQQDAHHTTAPFWRRKFCIFR